MAIYLDKYYIIDHFAIFKGTDYLVLYSPYLQNYLSYLVVLGITLKLKKPPLIIIHLLAAPELTREQSAIFRIKGEKIHIF